MKRTKELAIIGLFVALLIGGQFALSAVSGIEVVTVLLISFCFYYGVRRGVLVGVAFSLLRCLVFGFFPSVLILYLVYYPIFAVVFGLVGQKFNHTLTPKRHVFLVALGVVMVVLFTALDNVVTPLYYGFNKDESAAYAVASLSTMLPQILCNILTLSALLRPLVKLYKRVG
ncbi:MAG: hypothetical protein IJ033_02260 [Clostridia bacterium]|nr:hypothetical protein [Clostridia bacterium]